MHRDIVREFYPALAALVVFTALTGVVYPLVVTALAQVAFTHQANGSLVMRDGRATGSELIGQPFSDEKYFWSRPSATSPYPYNAASSSGSNLGPTNPALENAVSARIRALRDAEPSARVPVPVDLVTSSASGLDPHISPQAAEHQVRRVARARGLPVEEVRTLVRENTEDPTWGLLGEPRVNVLRLNLGLDMMARAHGRSDER
jgi:K+-transporting ATPase ATPase C chain